MSWIRLHKSALIAYSITDGDQPHVLLHPQADPKRVSEFMRRWAAELTYTAGPVTPQMLTALAFAQSDANPEYRTYIRNHRLVLLEGIPRQFMDGSRREIFSLFGLYAIPLPLARMLWNDASIGPDQLFKPEFNFKTGALYLAHIFRQNCETDVLQAALLFHCGRVRPGHTPFGVTYRDRFLETFISVFNTISIQTQTKEPDHAPQTQS